MDLRGTGWRENGENYIISSFIILYSSPYVVGVIR
jgi:hypothetical protein